MALILYDPLFDIINANGAPIAGAKAYFYLTGTTTPEAVYADNDLTTPLTNPVIADSAGRFPPIFLDPAITYRLIVKDASDVAISRGDVDPLNPTGTTGTASLQDGAVTTPKLAASAVTTPKIGDGQVTLAKLADVAGPTILGRDVGTGPPETLGYSDMAKAMGLTGMYASFPANPGTIPPGWLIRNGATVSTADYPNLSEWAQAYGVIATDATDKTNNPGKFYSTDSWVTFALPNSLGVFDRPYAGAGSIDTGRTVGSRQTDDLKAHTHTYNSLATRDGTGGTQTTSETGSGQTTGSTGGTETRPINDATLPCIRY